MKPHPDLHSFLKPYNPQISELTMSLRKFVTDHVPNANELIWDNYNAVAIAYSFSDKLKDAFCHIAVYSKHVNFGFNRGAELKVDNFQLEGRGKLIRHIKVLDWISFPQNNISELLDQAVVLAIERNPTLDLQKSIGVSMVMSVSPKKIRPTTSYE